MTAFQKLYSVPALLASFTMVVALAIPANSCPFCSAVARTFTEQIDTSDIVVIAALETKPEGADVAFPLWVAKATRHPLGDRPHVQAYYKRSSVH